MSKITELQELFALRSEAHKRVEDMSRYAEMIGFNWVKDISISTEHACHWMRIHARGRENQAGSEQALIIDFLARLLQLREKELQEIDTRIQGLISTT